MKRLNRLCSAIQTICPQGSLALTSIAEDPTLRTWKGSISVGCVILAEATGTTEEVIASLTDRLEKMSQRLLHQLSQQNSEEDAPSSKGP